MIWKVSRLSGKFPDDLMHKILQNHLLCAFVANLKIGALYPESFCDKNLAIRKVFAFCDSVKGCKGKFKNSEIYAIGWKGVSREKISRPIINQPNRHTFQFSPHISIGPPYSIEQVFSLSFSHIFPNILYITLLLRRHLILLPFFMSNLLSVQKRRRDADLAK